MAKDEVKGKLVELIEQYLDPYIDRSKVEIDKDKKSLKIIQDQQKITVREGKNCLLGLEYSDRNDKNVRSALAKVVDGSEGIMFGTEAGTKNLTIGTYIREEAGLISKKNYSRSSSTFHCERCT